MRELVRLAEVREAQAKQELVHLLQSRSNMFEAQNAAGEGQPDYATYDREIDDARRRMASAKEKFNKLRTVCISAQQVGGAAVPACNATAGSSLEGSLSIRSVCIWSESALQALNHDHSPDVPAGPPPALCTGELLLRGLGKVFNSLSYCGAATLLLCRCSMKRTARPPTKSNSCLTLQGLRLLCMLSPSAQHSCQVQPLLVSLSTNACTCCAQPSQAGLCLPLQDLRLVGMLLRGAL